MYQYPVDQCDVVDKEKLCVFREKRAAWISWLHGDDPHSIWGQITQLLWDDILFRTIYDLRREAVERPKENSRFNFDVLRLLDAGFITTQVTAIRRLTDKPGEDPKKGVISLRRLLKEIKDSREFITREVYVAYDGLPYDPKVSRERWLEAKQGAQGSFPIGWLPDTGPDAWCISDIVHKNFDRLSEISSAARARGDLISFKWFDYMEMKLSVCDDIRKYVDKFVAHAADPTSRQGLTEEQTCVTLDRLAACHKAVYQVAAFIYNPLLWEGSYGPVPVPQYDHLENLDKPWVAPGCLDKAREAWEHNLSKIKAWEQESLWPENSTEREVLDS